jgi:hypothetical protein
MMKPSAAPPQPFLQRVGDPAVPHRTMTERAVGRQLAQRELLAASAPAWECGGWSRAARSAVSGSGASGSRSDSELGAERIQPERVEGVRAVPLGFASVSPMIGATPGSTAMLAGRARRRGARFRVSVEIAGTFEFCCAVVMSAVGRQRAAGPQRQPVPTGRPCGGRARRA